MFLFATQTAHLLLLCLKDTPPSCWAWSLILTEDYVTSSTSNGDSRYQRVEMLLNTVQRCIVKSSKPEEVLLKFSIVLKNQSDDNLKILSIEMRS